VVLQSGAGIDCSTKLYFLASVIPTIHIFQELQISPSSSSSSSSSSFSSQQHLYFKMMVIQGDEHDDPSFSNAKVQMLQEGKQLGVNVVPHE
jgi:hypothetical protein